MPPLMNLRSVVAQVGRSIGCSRSFSASPNGAKEVMTAGKMSGSLFLPYLVSGYCVYVVVECYRGVEYFRKMYKARQVVESSRMLESNRKMIQSREEIRKMMGTDF